jgi:hypothetical protein
MALLSSLQDAGSFNGVRADAPDRSLDHALRQEPCADLDIVLGGSTELPEAPYLRLQAERCRTIEQDLTAPELIDMLANMAHEFDERAARLEEECESCGCDA